MSMLLSLEVDELVHERVVAVVFVFDKDENDEEGGGVSAAKKSDDEGTKGMVSSIVYDSFYCCWLGRREGNPCVVLLCRDLWESASNK